MPVTREDMRVVERVASRFVRRVESSERDDAVSDGMLILGRAVADWEADPAIRQRVDRATFVAGRAKLGMIDGLRQRNGRTRTGHYPKQRFRESALSLDAPVSKDHHGFGREKSLLEYVGEPDVDLESISDDAWVEQMLKHLPAREREVIERSVLQGESELSIGKDLGVSESRISQIRSRALIRLRGENFPMTREPPQRLNLTDREAEILQAVADDMTNREIAAKMFVSEETVKSHLRHINRRLSCKSRAGAVAIGFRAGLLT